MMSYLDKEYLKAYLRDDKKEMKRLRYSGAKVHVHVRRPVLTVSAALTAGSEYEKACKEETKIRVRELLGKYKESVGKGTDVCLSLRGGDLVLRRRSNLAVIKGKSEIASSP